MSLSNPHAISTCAGEIEINPGSYEATTDGKPVNELERAEPSMNSYRRPWARPKEKALST
jgi:hypothetical protein